MTINDPQHQPYPPQQASQGYPQQASQGYPQQASQGYPQQASQGYPQQVPQGYPQQMPPQGYPQQVPQGYPQQTPPQEWKVVKTGGTRHGMHALISLFTCGLWLPVWFCAWLFTKKHKVAVPR